MAPPHRCVNRSPSSCGKRGEEVLGQRRVALRVVLVPGIHPVAEVVDGVVAAPQDPVVRRLPVVVELVARVADPLPVLPADRVLLLLGERLGHQDVVPDRDDEGTHALHQGREDVGGQGDPTGPDRSVGRGEVDSRRVRGDAGHLRVLVEADTRAPRRPRFSPHASFAGCTRAQPPTVEEAGLEDRASGPPPGPPPGRGTRRSRRSGPRARGLHEGRPPATGAVATASSPVRSNSASMP